MTTVRLRIAGRVRLLALTVTALALSTLTLAATADTFDDSLLEIQHRWAEASYHATGKVQKQAFEALLDDARELSSVHSARAEAWVWHGIIASTYAGVKGPFGAMSLAKEARQALTTAEEIDPGVLDGSVYTSLGVLYSKVPGGLIGFGDDDLARQYLQKALAANPDGIDPNYFYGEFLFEHEDFSGARQALMKARQAPKRPDRPLADEGRQDEITVLLAEVERMLEKSS
jgi:tetratricopeptide (TPR) repeat protein